MGTGVGEAALLGAAIGGGSAAISGRDPLQGALMGGVTGGAFSGLGALAGAGEGASALAGEGATALAGEAGSSGLASLAPNVQNTVAATGNVMPDVAAQTTNAVAPASVPAAGTPLGTGQTGDLASKSLTGSMPQATPAGLREPGMFTPEPDWTSGVAAPSSSPSPFSPFRTVGKLYDLYKEQDKPTKVGIAALGALGAAKALNKPGSVPTPDVYDGPLSKFRYDPSTYTPYNYRPYAAGGPVEEMSRENAIGANTGYPQSDIQQGAYATPWQTPVSRNVVAGAGDVGVDQMTGVERMAEGGEASGGDSAGNTGIAALGPMMYSPATMSSSLVDPAAEYAAAQPMMDMSRQNFQNFLARYQNLPITEAAPEPVVYQGLYAGEGPKTAIAEPEWAGYSGASGGSVSPAGFGSGGGIANLGSYSDGGRLLKGPGDGMSDNIPATIGRKQPARLADGEFVVPADVVSGLGNGSTDAGAKQLYKMLDKVRSARTGTKKQGKQINPNKYMPA